MRHVYFYVAMLVCSSCCIVSSHASQELTEKMRQLAERIIATTKQQPVTIGVFSGSADLAYVNSGPGFEGLLADQLNALVSGVVRENAKYEVKGDFAFAKVRDPSLEGLKVVKVRARIIDKEYSEEQDRVQFEFALDHTKSIAEALQITGRLTDRLANGTYASKQKRNEEISEYIKKPTVHIDGSRVSSSSGSPYAIEVLVKPRADYEHQRAVPRPCKSENGSAFVEIDQGELYEVRIYNHSTSEVAVALTIDGLNVFHFSEDRITEQDAVYAASAYAEKDDYQQILKDRRKTVGQPKYSYYIVYPKGYKSEDGVTYDGTLTVVGWHTRSVGKDNYLSFLVTGYGKGAASKERMSARGNIGVIHASFSTCRPLPHGSRSAAGNETGFGPPRTVKTKAVNFEIDPPHDFIAIRYTRPQE